MKDKIRLHKDTLLIILFNLDNWCTNFKMQTKGMISRGSALVVWDYYLTVQNGNVIRRDSNAKLIDESACLCLDAVLFSRKQRGEEKNQM